jgi:tRNA pseudouridine55 synthase
MKSQKNLSGLLNLNKPSGITSRGAVNRVARLVRKIKVGHAGTLDPLASGVLVVALGSATRLIESVQEMPKTYQVTIRLDATSDTLDVDGHVVEFIGPRIPEPGEIQAALSRQLGTIEQLPPAYSALKVGGVRAYELAREGQVVALAPRKVVIHRMVVLSYVWPRVELEIECGGGTYVRSIARDLGDALGCGGVVEVLTRSRIGPFSLETAIEPAELTADSLETHLHPALVAVPSLPRVWLTVEQLADVTQGRPVRLDPPLVEREPGSGLAFLDPEGSLVAVGELAPGRDQGLPRKVLRGS